MNPYLIAYASFMTCSAALLAWECWRLTMISDKQHCDLLHAQSKHAGLVGKYTALLSSTACLKLDLAKARRERDEALRHLHPTFANSQDEANDLRESADI